MSRKITVPEMASEIALMMQSKRNSTSHTAGSICSTVLLLRVTLPMTTPKIIMIGLKVK